MASLVPRPGVSAQPSCLRVPRGGPNRRVRPHDSQRARDARRLETDRWCGARGWSLDCESRGYPDWDRHDCDVAECLTNQCLTHQWRHEGPITRSTRRPRGERQRACPTRRVAPDIRHASGDGGRCPAQYLRITLRRGCEGAQAHRRTARHRKDAAISDSVAAG
jgi:hypothetical protein